MYFAILGAGTAVALAVWVLKTAHSRPGTEQGHARHPLLQRAVLDVLTLLIRTSLRMGIRFGPMMMLTVPGRKSGLPRTNPVDLWTSDGRSFLVATHTEQAAWVGNLRAAAPRCGGRAEERARPTHATAHRRLRAPADGSRAARRPDRRVRRSREDPPGVRSHPHPDRYAGVRISLSRRQGDGVNAPATPRRPGSVAWSSAC
jgi:deazaflavin-dependent oxidoreductase (nitroreductase family)